MIEKNQVINNSYQAIHIRAERDILSRSNYDWIVDLKYSF